MPKKRLLHTPEILPDLPIETSERASFSFNDFAYTLARLIAAKGTETPLVIGVSGAWGSGKTSLLKLLREMLDKTTVLKDSSKPAVIDFVNNRESPQNQFRTCKTVWFNAWKYADEDELLVALVRVIVQAMFADDFISKSAALVLEPFTPRRDVIDTVLSWFSIKTPFGDARLNTGQPQETPLAKKTALLDLFNEAFDKLLAAWVHQSLDVNKIDPQKGVLVVFIDDLDRCLPAKAVQTLEAVKLFLDKPGCVFVLGADTRVVQSAVTKYYRDAGVTGENASDYLEKIIQLRFDLPPVSDAEMSQYVETQSTDRRLARHWRVISAGAELNPRKVKTFLNDINLAWALLRNTGKAHDGVYDDFVRWQALMRAAPDEFKKKVFEFDDRDLRFNFVGDALRWSQGGEDAKGLESYFAEYSNTLRLRRTLKAIGAFGRGFDAIMLDDFLHLSAPPPPVALEKKPEVPAEARKEPDISQGSIQAQVFEVPAPDLGVTSKDVMQSVPEKASRDSRFLTLAGVVYVKIPGGKFLVGSKDDDPYSSDDERPQHTFQLPTYWMSRFPVTNEQYAQFVQAVHKKHPVKDWEAKPNHPVMDVSWNDAQEYVQWLNTRVQSENQAYGARLPTEAEWEKAARGTYGSLWPWGNEFDPARCNCAESKKGSTTPVGDYSPVGDSPYGCADMAGNVWEWTQSLYKIYPYNPNDGREALDQNNAGRHVLRGGSFSNRLQYVRCAYRNSDLLPDTHSHTVGFRTVVVLTSVW